LQLRQNTFENFEALDYSVRGEGFCENLFSFKFGYSDGDITKLAGMLSMEV
jgi:hypothetical protein